LTRNEIQPPGFESTSWLYPVSLAPPERGEGETRQVKTVIGRQGWTPRRSFGRVAGQFKTPIACNIRRMRMALAWNE
jgi:hypothetical protein